MNSLNNEDIEYILSFISIDDIINFGLSCKKNLKISRNILTRQIKEINEYFKNDKNILNMCYSDNDLLKRVYFLGNNIYSKLNLQKIFIDFRFNDYEIILKSNQNKITLRFSLGRYRMVNENIYNYESDNEYDYEYDSFYDYDSEFYFESNSDSEFEYNLSNDLNNVINKNKFKKIYPIMERWEKLDKKSKIIKWNRMNKISEIQFFDKNVILGRPNKPSYLSYYKNGNKKIKAFFKNGKLNNCDNLPAYREWYENGNIKCIAWFTDGILNKNNSAAHKEWYENKKIKCKKWLINGNFIENKPSIIKWYNNGRKKNMFWHKDNKIHRDNEPAIIEWYDTGQLASKEWLDNGRSIRPKEKGPYAIFWKDKRKKGGKNLEYDEWYKVEEKNITMFFND